MPRTPTTTMRLTEADKSEIERKGKARNMDATTLVRHAVRMLPDEPTDEEALAAMKGKK